MDCFYRTTWPSLSAGRCGLAVLTAFAGLCLSPWRLAAQAPAVPGFALVLAAPVAMSTWSDGVVAEDSGRHPASIQFYGFPLDLAGLTGMALTGGISFTGKFTPFLYAGSSQMAVEFTNAVVTEIKFPTLEAGSLWRGGLALTLQPESMRKTFGPSVTVPPGGLGPPQRTWLPANFRLKIDGIDCTKVNKVNAITLEHTPADAPNGRGRTIVKVLPVWEPSTVTLELPAADAKEFYKSRDLVVKGNVRSAPQRSLEYTMLGANGKDVLVTLQGTSVSILAIHAPSTVRRGQPPNVAVDLSVNWKAAVASTIE